MGTSGYAKVSKTDRDDKNQETQLHILREFGFHEEHFFTDDASSVP